MGRLRRIPPVVLLALVLAPVLAVLHFGNPDELERLTVEDGVVETLEAVFYFLAAGLFAIVAVRAGRRSPWAGLIAFGLFLVGGEEISWGQRIFGIRTPSELERTNVQGELNLHNLQGVNGSVRAFGLMVIIVLFFAVPILHARVPALRRLLDRLRIPEVPWWSVPLALVALAYMVVPRVLGNDVSFQLDEVGELYLSAAAVAFGAGVLAETVARRRAATTTAAVAVAD